MAAPVLSDAEIAQLKKEQARAQSAAETFAASVTAQQARAAELLVADGGFKKFFDYYNTDIISKYDDERNAMNGQYIANPIVEADIEACASLQGNRIQPALPATDIIRIDEFDGGPLLVDPANEQANIQYQSEVETALVSGYPGFTDTFTTASTLLPSSTTLNVTKPTALTVAVNQVFVLSNLGDFSVVKVTGVTPTGTPPPYNATLQIQLLVPPSVSIASGVTPTAFTGFNNTERTNKTASNPNLQDLMNYFITELQGAINNRIARLNDQLTALAANQDPDGTAQITTATGNVNTSKTFLTNYLVTTIISNTGLATLSTERGVRSPQITTRLAQILANYTGQTENYYDKRYTFANNRANTARGSLRVQKAALQTADASQGYADTLTAQANSIGGILP